MIRARRIHRAGRRSGFTLLELLVVIAITGLVTAMGARAFVLLTSAWNETRTLADLERTIDTAFGVMEADIRDVASSEITGVAIVGEHRDAENQKEIEKAPDADDRLVLPVQGVVPGRSGHVSASIQYAVSRADTGASLTRNVGRLGADTPGENRSSIIPGVNVIRFRVEYATGDSGAPWAESWDRSYQPKALRVSMTVADPDKPWLQTSRKRVFPVNVK